MARLTFIACFYRHRVGQLFAIVFQAFNSLYKQFYETFNPLHVLECQIITVNPVFSGMDIGPTLIRKCVQFHAVISSRKK